MSDPTSLVLFQEKQIRRVWHEEEWFYAIVDVVEVLTDSKNASGYIKDMRRRDLELSKGWGQFATPLSIPTLGGRQKTNCANTKSIFRIIQSIPSAKAEPFKLWFAQVGYERVLEIENPELAATRARQLYREKGYPDEWIEMRLKSIEVRGKLTDEWKDRGVKEGIEYSILTAEISRATFGLAPNDYKEVKGLKRENLRDHMTDLELIFSMLGETSTRNKAIKTDAQGFSENHEAALDGGLAAGKALSAYEGQTGEKVVSGQNFLQQIKAAKGPKQLPTPPEKDGEA